MRESDYLYLIVICGIMFAGCAAPKLGVKNGMLTPCPKSPNCVISQDGDQKHSISPFEYKGSKKDAKHRLKQVVLLQKGSKITEETDTYMRFEFKTPIMRYVDDVEFYFPDNEKVIHVRSASRVGWHDMWANKKRVEKIRKQF